MEMTRCSIEPSNRTRYSKNYFKKIFHEAPKAAGEFIGNQVAEKIVEPDEDWMNVEVTIISP